MNFDAGTLARAWLSVAHASGADGERPALDRTVCVETFPDGIRLVATDSYVLLHAWVPSDDDDLAAEPDVDESPVSIAVCRDLDARGKGLLGYLLKLADDEDAPPFVVTVTVGVGVEASQGAFEGLEAEWLIIEYLDHERLKLHTYDGEYPSWRKVVTGFVPVATDAIAISPTMAGRLSKVGKLHPDAALRWWFGGTNKMAKIEIDGQPVVRGVVMPVRWDFDRDEPRPEKENKAKDTEAES